MSTYSQLQQTIEQIKNKAPKRLKVLQGVLCGQTDEEIAESMDIHPGTVRKQLSNLYEIFGITREAGDEQPRHQLIDLFAKYEQQLINDERSEYVPAQVKSVLHTAPKQPLTGCLPLHSPYYLERETDKQLREVFQVRTENDSLLFVKIQGSKGMGKSSTLVRIRGFLEQELEHLVVLINFGGTDFTNDSLRDLEKLLYQFTYIVSKNFQKIQALGDYTPPPLENYWKTDVTPGLNCTDYLEEHLFSKIDYPKTLLIDGLDAVLENEIICTHFSQLLRSWNEYKMKKVSKKPIVWANIVVAYSPEPYINHKNPSSPMQNIGLTLDLPEFNIEQIRYQARQYGLEWNNSIITRIMEWIGGHPELLNRTLYGIVSQKIDIEHFFLEATQLTNGQFNDYLLTSLKYLQEQPELQECFFKILNNEKCDDEFAKFKLDKVGLIKQEQSKFSVRFKLYQDYFQKRWKPFTKISESINLKNFPALKETAMPSKKIFDRDVFILVDQSASMIDIDEDCDKSRWELLGEQIKGGVDKILGYRYENWRICNEVKIYLFSRKRVGLDYTVLQEDIKDRKFDLKKNIFDENTPDSNTFISPTLQECIDIWFENGREQKRGCFILIYTDGLLDDLRKFTKIIEETCKKLTGFQANNGIELKSQEEIKIAMIGIGDEVKNNPNPFLDIDFGLRGQFVDKNGEQCDIFQFDLVDEMEDIIDFLSFQLVANPLEVFKPWIKQTEWYKENIL